MEIEKLRNCNLKKKNIGRVLGVVILGLGILATVIVKNQNVRNINMSKENIVAVYVESEDGSYSKVSDGKVSTSGYTLNTDNTKTRCTVSGEIDSNVRITYENGEVKVGGVTKSGTRCYFYFDKKPNAADVIPGGNETEDNMFAGTSGNGVYTWTKGDYSGGDQPIKYFRGNVDNNWVIFGKDGDQYIWWRIIRNNSNGSIRMIYSGTSSNKTNAPSNSNAMLSARAFNPSYDKNYYVGLKYATNSMHGTTTNAPILGDANSTDKTTLYGWYNATLGKSIEYSSKIDLDAGFCGNRNHSTKTSGPATASAVSPGTSTTIYYGSYINVINKKVPSLLCPNASDKFTDIPVGMITADEVMMVGMVYSSPANTNSWVHIGQHYWTMSPFWFLSNNGSARIFYVQTASSLLADNNVDWAAPGVRPVVNLKADVMFEEGGKGTSTSPYVVRGT